MKIYTEEEKEIFTNYFLANKENTREKYIIYVEKFVNENATYNQSKDKNFLDYNIDTKYSHFEKLDERWEYNTHNYLWGNEKNDNICTYLFSQPGFGSSRKKFSDLRNLRPNFNHINAEGDTILHINVRLKKEVTLYSAEYLISEGVDPDVKNNKGEYFSYLYFLDNKLDYSQGDNFDGIGTLEIIHLGNLNKIFNRFPHHFFDASYEQAKGIRRYIDITMDVIKERIKKSLASYQHDKTMLNTIEIIEQEAKILEENFAKYSLKALLEKDLNQVPTTTTQRNKI